MSLSHWLSCPAAVEKCGLDPDVLAADGAPHKINLAWLRDRGREFLAARGLNIVEVYGRFFTMFEPRTQGEAACGTDFDDFDACMAEEIRKQLLIDEADEPDKEESL